MADAKENSLNVVTQPACLHLLSKGMLVTEQLHPADDPIEPTGDGNCWCNKTQNALGPDDGLVEREACVSSRSCYEVR